MRNPNGSFQRSNGEKGKPRSNDLQLGLVCQFFVLGVLVGMQGALEKLLQSFKNIVFSQ